MPINRVCITKAKMDIDQPLPSSSEMHLCKSYGILPFHSSCKDYYEIKGWSLLDLNGLMVIK